MSDLPGTAAVGIETAEWSAESGGNLTVRITGRWRRRRPITTGQPTLVIEAEGRRHRYPAMPEPPSLAGTGPGVWRLSFTVPGWLAPDLGRTWLQFGTVVVPLPVAVPAPGEPRPAHLEEHVSEPRLVQVEESAGGPRGSAPEYQSAPPPAPPPGPGLPAVDAPGVAALASRVTALEHELHAARTGRDELLASLAERDRSRRIAEQRAHAEQALRQDLARQLSSSVREAERARQAMGDLAAAEDQIRALERELQEARRRSDEAEQVAATATAARERAERERERAQLDAVRGAEATNAESARLRFEQQLRGRRAGTAAWVPAEPLTAALRPPGGDPVPWTLAPDPAPAALEPRFPATRTAPSYPAADPAPSYPAADPAPRFSLAEPAPRFPVAEPAARPPAAELLPSAPAAQPAARAELAAGAESPPGGRLVETLRRELDARARTDASLRARLIEAETRLAARVLLDQRTTAVLAQVRSELETLRDALARERARRSDAEGRTAELEVEVSALHGERGLRAEAERRAAELEVQVSALHGERALRAEAERRVGELERELSGQRALSHGAYDAIGELRRALERLNAAEPVAVEPRSVERVAAEPDPEPVAIAPAPEPGPVTMERVAAPAAEPEIPDPEPSPAPAPAVPPILTVEPARLNDALTRLRESIAPHEAPAGTGAALALRPPTLHEALGRPSLERAFRKLARADADAAGRLLLELLPLQRVVYPHAVTYDLVLGPGRGCVCVTVPNGTVTIGVQSTPRPRAEVDFQVLGEPARIARLLVAGRFRRRFGLRVARVRGPRQGVAALSALLGTPLDLSALHHAGVRFDPATAFALVASMIDPAWTARERFTLAHVEPAAATTYVIVRDGRPIQVTRTAPEGRITTTLGCKADQLLAALAGESVSGLTVSGDDRPLASLREWIRRAQSE